MSHMLLVLAVAVCYCNGFLFPKDSPSRLVKELNGIWNFRIDDSPSRNAGFDEKWYSQPLSKVHNYV